VLESSFPPRSTQRERPRLFLFFLPAQRRTVHLGPTLGSLQTYPLSESRTARGHLLLLPGNSPGCQREFPFFSFSFFDGEREVVEDGPAVTSLALPLSFIADGARSFRGASRKTALVRPRVLLSSLLRGRHRAGWRRGHSDSFFFSPSRPADPGQKGSLVTLVGEPWRLLVHLFSFPRAKSGGVQVEETSTALLPFSLCLSVSKKARCSRGRHAARLKWRSFPLFCGALRPSRKALFRRNLAVLFRRPQI